MSQSGQSRNDSTETLSHKLESSSMSSTSRKTRDRSSDSHWSSSNSRMKEEPFYCDFKVNELPFSTFSDMLLDLDSRMDFGLEEERIRLASRTRSLDLRQAQSRDLLERLHKGGETGFCDNINSLFAKVSLTMIIPKLISKVADADCTGMRAFARIQQCTTQEASSQDGFCRQRTQT